MSWFDFLTGCFVGFLCAGALGMAVAILLIYRGDTEFSFGPPPVIPDKWPSPEERTKH